jgi:hypothetical protein
MRRRDQPLGRLRQPDQAVAGVFSRADSQCLGDMCKFAASTANRAPRFAAPERPVARV